MKSYLEKTKTYINKAQPTMIQSMPNQKKKKNGEEEENAGFLVFGEVSPIGLSSTTVPLDRAF